MPPARCSASGITLAMPCSASAPSTMATSCSVVRALSSTRRVRRRAISSSVAPHSRRRSSPTCLRVFFADRLVLEPARQLAGQPAQADDLVEPQPDVDYLDAILVAVTPGAGRAGSRRS